MEELNAQQKKNLMRFVRDLLIRQDFIDFLERAGDKQKRPIILDSVMNPEIGGAIYCTVPREDDDENYRNQYCEYEVFETDNMRRYAFGFIGDMYHHAAMIAGLEYMPPTEMDYSYDNVLRARKRLYESILDKDFEPIEQTDRAYARTAADALGEYISSFRLVSDMAPKPEKPASTEPEMSEEEALGILNAALNPNNNWLTHLSPMGAAAIRTAIRALEESAAKKRQMR